MNSEMMDLDIDDPRFIHPDILKKELVISLPVLTESDIEIMLNGTNSSHGETSSDDDGEKEKPCLKRDQRRLTLLNNPDYGVILCFIDKFRSYINIKKYPLRILEDNLISEQEKLSQRFIEFILVYLKEFIQFAYRYNHEDGDHLNDHGYSKTKVDIKLRVLKNLLEKQLECDQKLKNAVTNKSAIEIRSKPFGRDRFGASYWLYADTDCFFRLFRENIDENCTWSNVAKNQSELENIIKILITDHVIRKKFPGWTFSYHSFNSLSSSTQFEERYGSNLFHCKNKAELMDAGHSSFVLFHSGLIKPDHVDFDPVVNLDRDLPSSSPEPSPKINSIEENNDFDPTSDNESINSIEITANCFRASVSVDTRDDMYPLDFSQDSSSSQSKSNEIDDSVKPIVTKSIIVHDDTPVVMLKPSVAQGTKLKLVDYDDSESQNETDDTEKHDEASQNSHHSSTHQQSAANTDLPIALRRSKRGRRSFAADLSPSSSSTSISAVQGLRRKRSIDETWKGSSHLSRSNGYCERNSSRRRRRHRRRGKRSKNRNSSSTSDEQNQFIDDDDDLSDDYLQTNTALDNFFNGDLLEEDDEDDHDYISQRKAKTVDQCHEKYHISPKACTVCSQTTYPDRLLLCEDCDDAYHLECLVPELLSVPYDNWYCPLCDHKRLCDALIEKLFILIQDQRDYEMKRRLYVSKRRKRLTNVAVNVDRYVQQSKRDIQTRRDTSSDEENARRIYSTNDEDILFGFKADTFNSSTYDEDSAHGYISNKNYNSICNDDNTYGHRNITTTNPVNDDIDSAYRCKSNTKTKPTNKDDEDDDDDDDSVYGSKNKKKTNSMNNGDSALGSKRKKKNSSTNDDDSVSGYRTKKNNVSTNDEDSVYGMKNDENRKPSDQEEEPETAGKRRVRSCRRKVPSYSFDDYDKKIKEAMIHAGVNKDLVEVDSDDSDEMISRKKSSKKRFRYDQDEDFDALDGKNKDEYVPSGSRRRAINEDSRSDARDFDDNDDFGMSDDDSAWLNRRKLSISSAAKKKSTSTSNRNNNRKSTIRSDEDSTLSQTHMDYFPSNTAVKSEPIAEFDQTAFRSNASDTNETVPSIYDTNTVVNHPFDINSIPYNTSDETPTVKKPSKRTRAVKKPSEKAPRVRKPAKKTSNVTDPLTKNTSVDNESEQNQTSETTTNNEEGNKESKPRRPRRAATTKKKTLIEQENVSDDEDDQNLPLKRRTYTKYRDSNDTPPEVDDDYDRLANKRRQHAQGKTTTRVRITDHIKKLVGNEDDEEDQDKNQDETRKDKNNNSKPAKQNSLYDEYQISDDDDFPDEEEIIRTTGLTNLKKSAPAPVQKAPVFRAPYEPSIASYQFAMIDPTANFDLTCMPEPSMTEPSDSNQINANNSQTTTNS